MRGCKDYVRLVEVARFLFREIFGGRKSCPYSMCNIGVLGKKDCHIKRFPSLAKHKTKGVHN